MLLNDCRRKNKCENTAKMRRVEGKGNMQSVREGFLEEVIFIFEGKWGRQQEG